MNDAGAMARALELARRPLRVSPNPRVGALLVRDGALLGEGAHEGAGRPHAETVALTAAGAGAKGATLYVTLEPCTHHGRTPPCVEALIAAGVARVVIGAGDPDPRVDGGGIASLRAAGIETVVGIGAEPEAHMNRAYRHRQATGRPLVTVKLAQSLDGRVAARDRSSRWISGEESRARVHRRRAEVDWVMTGSGTVVTDDPSLTARVDGVETQPGALIVDSAGRVPPDARLFRDDRPVLIATTARSPHEVHTTWKEAGADVVVLPEDDGHVSLDALVEHLAAAGTTEVYCEGGPRVATSLVRSGIAGRIELYVAPLMIGGDGLSLGELGVTTMTEALGFRLTRSETVGDDVLMIADRWEA